MARTVFHQVCICLLVFSQLMRESSQDNGSQTNGEYTSPPNRDVVLRQETEQESYNGGIKKYNKIKITCRAPEIPENGIIRGEGIQIGSVLHLECRQGYRLVGQATLTCISAGDKAVWGPVEPRACVATQEGAIPFPHAEKSSETIQGIEPEHSVRENLGNPPSYSPANEPISVEKFRLSELLERKEEEPRETIQEKTYQLPAQCVEEPTAGPCKAYFKRYYFNKVTMECHTFIYGGCNGNNNNFVTMRECNLSCLGHE